ncbi:MAG: hypothetical protein KBD78_10190 [Oligoflexales bacterium]|nr:hypothetical protein [Oligoflexales bacterium]
MKRNIFMPAIFTSLFFSTLAFSKIETMKTKSGSELTYDENLNKLSIKGGTFTSAIAVYHALSNLTSDLSFLNTESFSTDTYKVETVNLDDDTFDSQLYEISFKLDSDSNVLLEEKSLSLKLTGKIASELIRGLFLYSMDFPEEIILERPNPRKPWELKISYIDSSLICQKSVDSFECILK